MAKKKTAHPLHMHVPTKIGLTVVGITVLVYILFLTMSINSSNKTQTYQSQASSLYCRGTIVCPSQFVKFCYQGAWRCRRLPNPPTPKP